MQQSPTLFIILSLLTLLVLIVGVLVMARGGEISKKYSNKLMTMRVAMQALAIFALALLYFCAKK
jgi:hypothetical protein